MVKMNPLTLVRTRSGAARRTSMFVFLLRPAGVTRPQPAVLENDRIVLVVSGCIYFRGTVQKRYIIRLETCPGSLLIRVPS